MSLTVRAGISTGKGETKSICWPYFGTTLTRHRVPMFPVAPFEALPETNEHDNEAFVIVYDIREGVIL